MFPVLFLSWVFSAVLLVSIIQLFTSVCRVWLSYKTFMQFTQYIIMQTASIPKRQYHFSLFSIFKMGYSLKNCFQCDEMQKLNMMINNYENQKTTPYLNDKSLFHTLEHDIFKLSRTPCMWNLNFTKYCIMNRSVMQYIAIHVYYN